jgi:hypothetical protein
MQYQLTAESWPISENETCSNRNVNVESAKSAAKSGVKA